MVLSHKAIAIHFGEGDFQMSRISIVMSFFNESAFIVEAIDSVLAQTYRDWQLVLVDDGSSDGSGAIARAFAARHRDRMRYVEHPGHANRGTSASRNLGLLHSDGDMIAFLDADDVYLPERLQRHVTLLESMPEVDMVQSNALRWFAWADPGLPDIVGPVPSGVGTIVQAPEMLRQSLQQDPEAGWFPCTCSVTIRRSAIAKVGGFEEDFFRLCEDWAFWQKIYLHGNVYVTGDVVARYRKHCGSVLHRAANDWTSVLGERYYAHLAYLRWLNVYLERHGADRKILRLVRRKLWPDGSRFLHGTLGLPPALGLTLRTAASRLTSRLRAATHDTIDRTNAGLQPMLGSTRRSRDRR